MQLIVWKIFKPVWAESTAGCRWVFLVAQPCVKCRRRFRNDGKAHPGMFRAAILRAFAPVGSRRVGFQPDMIRQAGNQLHLARQRRHPEIVDHVRRFQPDEPLPADGNVDFIRGHHAGFGIAHFPPPLMAITMRSGCRFAADQTVASHARRKGEKATMINIGPTVQVIPISVAKMRAGSANPAGAGKISGVSNHADDNRQNYTADDQDEEKKGVRCSRFPARKGGI